MERGRPYPVTDANGHETGWMAQAMDSEATSDRGRHHYRDICLLPSGQAAFLMAKLKSDVERVRWVRDHAPRNAVESTLKVVLGGHDHVFDWQTMSVAPQGGGFDFAVSWFSP